MCKRVVVLRRKCVCIVKIIEYFVCSRTNTDSWKYECRSYVLCVVCCCCCCCSFFIESHNTNTHREQSHQYMQNSKEYISRRMENRHVYSTFYFHDIQCGLHPSPLMLPLILLLRLLLSPLLVVDATTCYHCRCYW